MNLYPVSISLSSYGADLVREQGQAAFIDVLKRAGASIIELREELFTEVDLPTLNQAISAQGLACVYSSPIELWQVERTAPNPLLAATLAKAADAGARWLKVSLGVFTAQCDFAALNALLAHQPVRLLVENDQTNPGGHIEPMAGFFAKAREQRTPVGMTFDIGNWQWQAQSVQGAARQLGQYVEYVHCKGVKRNAAGKLVATPPDAQDLEDWTQLLGSMAPGVMRAVEFPLVGDDLVAVTGEQVHTLARLGQPAQEVARHG
ncbi:AP endonuclease [Pseudomonas abieticivorans]|uniref:AP endonuclease n=1 Tax=Pseudomonas abieticivorans TaxID=2931382 RepID=UPI0020BE7F51|nr:AP endonuclease [Pseudomonas sp. PIA16]